MAVPRLCPDCGSVIAADAPAGLCPRCLLEAGLESQNPQPEHAPTQASPGYREGFVPPAPEELAARLPQLEILELLGKGGMGAVYKARQPGLDRLVAVKILPPEVSRNPAFAERFIREARALARLSHPHIVAVYDFGQVGDLCYFVMEFVDGVNLRQAIAASMLKAADALALVPQICDALQFAHDEGIVHRDIKPANILLDKRGRVKIADFGLAKLLGNDQIEASLTATHQVMGTLRYMAPEQMEGSRTVDHRADIYSLGVVFYEMLTGELPIGRFAPPSNKVEIDVRFDEVVLRALENEPNLRYQQASEVKTDVEAIRIHAGPPSKTPTGAVPERATPSTAEPKPFRLSEGNRTWAKGILLTTAFASLFLMMSSSATLFVDRGQVRLGSPWMWFEMHRGPSGSGMNIHLQSWQWLVAAAGIAAYWGYLRIKKSKPNPAVPLLWQFIAVVLIVVPLLAGAMHLFRIVGTGPPQNSRATAEPIALRGPSVASNGFCQLKSGGMYLVPGELGLIWSSVQPFDDAARVPFAIVFKHDATAKNPGQFPCPATLDKDSGKIEQVLELGGRKVVVQYGFELDPESRKIRKETLIAGGEAQSPVESRLIVVDLTADPPVVKSRLAWLPVELVDLEKPEEIRRRVPGIVKTLREKTLIDTVLERDTQGGSP